MLKIGRVQLLKIRKINAEGALLECAEGKETVLLSADQVSFDKKSGDMIEVFIFPDHYSQPVASTKRPACQAGEIGYLKVIDYHEKGAFLDWNFMVDIFAPNSLITYELRKGKSYLFRIFVNNKGKIRATTDIYDHLRADSPYVKNDQVKGTVYKKLKNGSCLVAVDNKYYGLIPASEYFQRLEYGQQISGRIIRVREDGKLDISPRQVAHIQLKEDAEIILEKIRSKGGCLKLNDRSDPRTIKRQLQMSKKAFKRAVGRLLKEGYIKQTQDSLILK